MLDDAMKVLFVCTANVARSPMAAEIFLDLAGRDGRYAARAVGTASWAVRRLTTRDLAWADIVAVMERRHLAEIQSLWPRQAAKVRVLDVLDDYDPGDLELRELLTGRLKALLSSLESDRVDERPSQPCG
jgi:predicted protein tyrosine phosphatase